VKSTELARWLRAWLRGKGHQFGPANLGIPAATCFRCGLVVTTRARIFDPYHIWILPDRCPDWPSPYQLQKAIQIVPDCGVSIVRSVMES
jgi:hypothetical protein